MIRRGVNELARRATVIRLMRYSAVSLVATTTSLVVLGMLVGLVELPATWSNIIATAVGTVPSFELNRRWVWSSTGRRSLFGQIVPFCALSCTGLVVSTLAVGMMASRTAGWSHWSHTVAVLMANIAAYGTLWVVQYQMLDRVLFRTAGRDRAQVVNVAGPVSTARSRWEPEELPGDRTLPGWSSGSTTLKQ
jgi:putative flippase GtrA